MNKTREIIVTQTFNEMGVQIDLKTAPLVRCKDCEFWDKDEDVLDGGICGEWSDFEDSIISYTKPDDYCSFGERKEQENE